MQVPDSEPIPKTQTNETVLKEQNILPETETDRIVLEEQNMPTDAEDFPIAIRKGVRTCTQRPRYMINCPALIEVFLLI